MPGMEDTEKQRIERDRRTNGMFGQKPQSGPEVALAAPRSAPLKRLSLSQSARSISEITRPSSRADFDLAPPYQRGSVWTEQQRVALVRSVLMGLPIGSITLNERPDPAVDEPLYAAVDGKQRIEALRAFVDSEVRVPAHWFEDADIANPAGDEITTVTYAELTQRGRLRFERMPVAITHASVATIAEEAEIYDLINTGGTPQTDDDIANARAVAEGR